MPKNEELTYEQALEELQTIVRELQENKVGIEALSQRVERARRLIHFCRNRLRGTEERLEGLLGDEEE